MVGKMVNRFLKLKKLYDDRAFYNISYSQEAEDLILARYFEHIDKGFYVDVGAHHPKRFSNTYKFYLRGWRGINIDAMPGSMDPFKKIKPEDINLEVPIAEKKETLKYFIFNEPALNTLNEDEAQKKSKIQGYYIKEIIELQTERLDQILKNYLPDEQTTIDFLNIDVEGLDLQVLKSNDWKKYRPQIVLVEELRNSLETVIEKSLVYSYMKSVGYSLVSRSYNTSFYQKDI